MLLPAFISLTFICITEEDGSKRLIARSAPHCDNITREAEAECKNSILHRMKPGDQITAVMDMANGTFAILGALPSFNNTMMLKDLLKLLRIICIKATRHIESGISEETIKATVRAFDLTEEDLPNIPRIVQGIDKPPAESHIEFANHARAFAAPHGTRRIAFLRCQDPYPFADWLNRQTKREIITRIRAEITHQANTRRARKQQGAPVPGTARTWQPQPTGEA